MSESIQSKQEFFDNQEPTPNEVIKKAIESGYIVHEDVDALGDDIDDIVGNLYGYIIEQGDDPDEVFARWGIVAEV